MSIPGRSQAAPLILVALTTRIFWSMQLHYPQVQNAAWICPLVGIIFYLPFTFVFRSLNKIGQDSIWGNIKGQIPAWIQHTSELLFAALLLADCSVSLRILANAASVMALGDASMAALILPLALAIVLLILLGGDSTGNAARIWLRILPLLLVPLLIVQFDRYNPAWLTPVLGNGLRDIIGGAFYCASGMALITLLWLVAVPDRCKHGPLFFTALSAVFGSILLLLQQMLAPALVDIILTRASRIEMLLGNGRISVSVQLLLIMIWYGSLFFLIAEEAVSAAIFIRSLCLKLPKWLISASIALITAFLSSTQSVQIAMEFAYQRGVYIVLAAILLIIIASFRRKDIFSCAETGN